MSSDWTSQDWYALGTMLLGVGAVAGGFWALYNYHRARRTEAARWLHDVFKDFYLADTFREVRLLLEYNYPERAGPLLERRITDRQIPVSTEEITILEQLDSLLDYFEHVLYLESEGQLSRNDRQAVFEYWFDVMGADERASLRRYVATFGFERVARALNASAIDFVAAYGSLRKGLALPDLHDDLPSYLADRGKCVIPGTLYNLGDYPGLKPGEGRVVGELYEILDKRAFRLLDEYERYNAASQSDSLYLRRCIRLTHPNIDAWVYIYNDEVSPDQIIASGDWALNRTAGPRED